MLDIKVNTEQIKYVKELLAYSNFGKRGEFDGNYHQQLTGILSQTVVADLLEQPRPVNNGKPDGGVDYIINGKTVDIKSMTRNVPMQDTFVHNFYGAQVKFDTEILLFASYNQRAGVVTLCGWLPKSEFIKKADFFPEGSIRCRDNGSPMIVRGKAGNYEIKQTFLNPIDNVNAFIRAVS